MCGCGQQKHHSNDRAEMHSWLQLDWKFDHLYIIMSTQFTWIGANRDKCIETPLFLCLERFMISGACVLDHELFYI